MKNSNKKGFTLIELIIVIAVISMLSGVVIQNLNNARSKSRNAVRLENAEAIAKAFQVATTAANNNQFPSSGGWRCLGKNGCWNGLPELSQVNNILRTGLVGGSIPVDPIFISPQLGDAYIYSSDSAPTPPNGPLSGVMQPRGAYLAWVMEAQSGGTCGRGIIFSTTVTGSTGYECMLYLGPPTAP